MIKTSSHCPRGRGRSGVHTGGLWLWVLVLAVVATGCRSQKGLVQDGGKAVGEKEIRTVKEPRLDTIMNADITTYSANFTCTARGKSIKGQLRISHDSIIWISVSKIIELGRGMCTPTNVKGYAKIIDKYFDGSYADIKERWGYDVDYATLEALLLGNCPPKCTQKNKPERQNDSVTLWYRQSIGAGRDVTLLKSFASKLLLSTRIVVPTLRQQITVVYEERQEVEGRMLPSSMTVMLMSAGQQKLTMRIKLEKIALGQQQNYPMRIPTEYEPL